MKSKFNIVAKKAKEEKLLEFDCLISEGKPFTFFILNCAYQCNTNKLGLEKLRKRFAKLPKERFING